MTQIFRVKSGEGSNALFTLPKQLIHKHLHLFGEGWRVFLKLADNRYMLQRITNPQRKGRAFFYSGLQIRWDAWRKTDAWRKICVICAICVTFFKDRTGRASVSKSVRNPWSKNALLTQRNPMKKYPGEEWVKSGEEWCATLHLSQPQCLSGFQPIWWRVKSKKESCCLYQLPTYSFVPGNGRLLPW